VGITIDEALTKAAEVTGYTNTDGDAEPVTPVEADATGPVETTEAKGGRERDEGGKFKAKPAEVKPETPKNGAPDTAKVPPGPGAAATTSPKGAAAPVVQGPAQLPSDKAPANWKPVAREQWAAMPTEARQEWTRREKEMAAYVARTEEDRKVVGRVRESLAPYEGVARANGVDAMTYAGQALQAAAQLQLGTPIQRAALVASIISSYGVDLGMINAHLQGQAPQAPAQPIDIDALVDRKFQAREERFAQETEDRKFAEFQATDPEFLEQVADDMIDVYAAARRRGEVLSYQQAYERACRVNPDVATILTQREAAKAAPAASAATAQARAAANASMRTNPAPGISGQPKGVDEAFDRAREKLGM
jgi:hypothetical protein